MGDLHLSSSGGANLGRKEESLSEGDCEESMEIPSMEDRITSLPALLAGHRLCSISAKKTRSTDLKEGLQAATQQQQEIIISSQTQQPNFIAHQTNIQFTTGTCNQFTGKQNTTHNDEPLIPRANHLFA